MNTFVFNSVACIVSGAGSSLALAQQCKSLGMCRPVLVSDPVLIELGLLAPVQSALEKSGLSPLIFDKVQQDPPESVVLAAAEFASAHSADGVIGVGGGSSMDVAKVVAVLLAGEQSLTELYGVDQVSGGRLPLILMPTTAGTGSASLPSSSRALLICCAITAASSPSAGSFAAACCQ